MIQLQHRTGYIPLILASASPRRTELLRLLVQDFESQPAEIDESPRPSETAAALVERLALEKAQVASRSRPEALVIGADTVVVLEGEVLGKPLNGEQAQGMLTRLSGRTHEVLTGVSLAYGGQAEIATAQTQVTFSHLSDREIRDYVATGEPLDKAGAYGIQGYGSRFVEKVDGCYFNVVGLPVSLLYRMLKRTGFRFHG
ncbi:MAG: Maf family protein [Acidobacteriota bacterium]